VRRESNPDFHELISNFFARTGVPLVINTSFNDSEPIVCTPADAIVTFRKSGLDALFMFAGNLPGDGCDVGYPSLRPIGQIGITWLVRWSDPHNIFSRNGF
jgi:hypothetical protein